MLNRRTLLRLIGFGSAAAPIASVAVQSQQQLEVLDTYVAGFHYYQSLDIVKRMIPGGPLMLQREPDNSHDENAIVVYWKTQKLGYIPRVNNLALSRLMDEGREIVAEISWISNQSWRPVGLVVSVVV